MTLGTLKTIGRLLVYEGKTQQTKGRLWLLADEQARFNARVASPDFRAPVALCILEEIQYVVPKPSEHLPELWQLGVFKTARSLEAVIREFEKIGFNFSPQAVSMALMRAPYLTRRGKKGGYTYSQKGPFKST